MEYKHVIVTRGEFCIGPGWAAELEKLFFDVENKLRGSYARVDFTQVKEKFGELRLYYDLKGDFGQGKLKEEVMDMIDKEVERISLICEKCGNPDATCGAHNGCWIKTLCRDCITKAYPSKL